MRIVFMGTPEFAVPTLEKLSGAGLEIALVVSQPDRPSGRGRKTLPTPVKAKALGLGIEAFQPKNVNAEESVKKIGSMKPELIVVAAFGQILKNNLLTLPPLGCVNLHSSLLPKLRGAAPINRAVMEGETLTGVTTMMMNKGMDEGDILLTADTKIEPHTTAGALHDHLSLIGADLMLDTVRKLEKGELEAKPQDHEKATYAPKIEAKERAIDWSEDAVKIDGKIRGLSPHPGAYTFFREKRLLILDSRIAGKENADAAPGTITGIEPDYLEVSAGNGKLAVLEILPEGKKAMPAGKWVLGARVKTGERFYSNDK